MSEENWEKFNDLLGRMGMALIPIKHKSRAWKIGDKSYSKKGVRELKNLKCDINYEKGRGASNKKRELQVINEDNFMECAGVGVEK